MKMKKFKSLTLILSVLIILGSLSACVEKSEKVSLDKIATTTTPSSLTEDATSTTPAVTVTTTSETDITSSAPTEADTEQAVTATTTTTATATKKPTTTTTPKVTTTVQPSTTPKVTTTKKPTITTTAKPKTTTTTTTKKPTSTTPTTLPTSGQGSASDGEAIQAFINEVVRLTNELRAENGLSALTLDADLTAVAMVRAEEITKLFDHTRPDGTSCFTAFEEGGLVLGENVWSMAENIAYGYSSPQAVFNGWKNSTGHRENMLNADFNAIGIGVVKKNGVYYWTQEFVTYR